MSAPDPNNPDDPGIAFTLIMAAVLCGLGCLALGIAKLLQVLQ
ncbi:hypothetical protein HDIA_2232 [Hartmannibacter diazotrophicus]|uniref:Uncharacterized protein n=1 Tax=Hartmannibacter diazotrophicus TaxID=1482074 RepID=A0A2C9D6A5_9HYPH|nr:hypothetical protein [Hartmannibacter diazotrophicus]SON55773.1 hypothetical protein HDIA_2232 [Hartmannibacter diazotrophicus]